MIKQVEEFFVVPSSLLELDAGTLEQEREQHQLGRGVTFATHNIHMMMRLRHCPFEKEIFVPFFR